MLACNPELTTRDEESRLERVARRAGDSILLSLLETRRGSNRRLGDEARDQIHTRLMEVYRVSADPEAYECLYEESQPVLRRMVLARLRHVTPFLDANDILQDTFVNVYRYPTRFRANRPTAFRDWVGTIVQNTIRRHLKKQLRDAKRCELVGERIDDREDPRGEPVDEVSVCEQRRLLRHGFHLLLGAYLHAYSRLTERDQRILHLVEVEGLLYRDAAELLSVRAENMKMLVFRARRKVYRGMNRILEAA